MRVFSSLLRIFLQLAKSSAAIAVAVTLSCEFVCDGIKMKESERERERVNIRQMNEANISLLCTVVHGIHDCFTSTAQRVIWLRAQRGNKSHVAKIVCSALAYGLIIIFMFFFRLFAMPRMVL